MVSSTMVEVPLMSRSYTTDTLRMTPVDWRKNSASALTPFRLIWMGPWVHVGAVAAPIQLPVLPGWDLRSLHIVYISTADGHADILERAAALVRVPLAATAILVLTKPSQPRSAWVSARSKHAGDGKT